MKVEKEKAGGSIDALGSKEQPITVDDEDEDQLIISLPDDLEQDDVVCLVDLGTKNPDKAHNVEINFNECFHRRPEPTGSKLISAGVAEKELPLNNVPSTSTAIVTEEEINSQEFRYFHNPLFQMAAEKPSTNDNILNIYPPIASTSRIGKRPPGTAYSNSCQLQSSNPISIDAGESNNVQLDPPPEDDEIIVDYSCVKSSTKPKVPKIDPFFPPAPRQQIFSTLSDPTTNFSTSEYLFGMRDKWKKSSSIATEESLESDTLRRPGYLPSPMSSNSDNFNFNRQRQPTFTGNTFMDRNGPPRKYPPRVPGSVDVFATHRDDQEKRITSKDLDILNNYLGQCMFEETETDFIMGFEYKKITNGQAQFNCSNKEMAIWTIDKIQKFTELPMKTSLRNMRPRINAFMWMTNLPHFGDTLPKISDVLRGLVKCNPGFESHFKITVIRVTKQKNKPGKYFFHIMVDEDLLSYIRSRMVPPFMRICVLKYFNVKVFFKERIF